MAYWQQRTRESLNSLCTRLIALDQRIELEGSTDMKQLDNILYDAYRIASVKIPEHLKYVGKERNHPQPKKPKSTPRYVNNKGDR